MFPAEPCALSERRRPHDRHRSPRDPRRTEGAAVRRSRCVARTPHKRAIAIFVVSVRRAVPRCSTWCRSGTPSGSPCYVVQRKGTFGPAQEVFGGLTQYVRVFADAPFWDSVGRVLLFGVVQVPVMLGLALLLALLLDSPLVKGKQFFRLAFFVPYAVPGVIAAIMWGFLYSPNLSPFTAVTSTVDFSRRRARAVVDRQRRDLGVRRLQHADHLLGAAGDPHRGLRGGAARRRGPGAHRVVDQDPAGRARRSCSPRSSRSSAPCSCSPSRRCSASFSSAVSSTYTPNMTVYATSSIPNITPGRGLLGRAGARDVRPVLRLPEGHPAEGGRLMSMSPALAPRRPTT